MNITDNKFKFSSEKPACFPRLKEYFPDIDSAWETGIAITYGDTVYSKYKLRPDVLEHELVHLHQQKDQNKDDWMEKYCRDKVFRASVEEPAYVAQAAFIRIYCKDRNQRFKLIHQLAIVLSSDMYGKMMTYSEALKLLS